jgi:hypothetical protein
VIKNCQKILFFLNNNKNLYQRNNFSIYQQKGNILLKPKKQLFKYFPIFKSTIRQTVDFEAILGGFSIPMMNPALCNLFLKPFYIYC